MLLTIKVNPILGQLKIMEHGCCSASRKTTNITDINDVRLIFFPVILGSLTPTEDDDCCASHSDSIVNGACFQIYSL